MEDTAVLAAPDTAAPPEATALEVTDLAPDSADGLEVATETEGDEQATDSGDQGASEWDGLTPAEIAAKVAERIEAKEREVEARKEESFRQREENAKVAALREQARQQDAEATQHAAQVRNGLAYQTFMRTVAPAIKEAFDAGREQPDPGRVVQALNAASQQVALAATTDVMNAVRTSFTPEFSERFGADFATRLDPANAAAIQHAFDTRNMSGVIRSVLDAAEHLNGQKVRTKAEAEAAAKAVPAEKPKATSPRQPSPTRAGTPAGRVSATAVLDSARPGSPEYMRAYKEKYGL